MNAFVYIVIGKIIAEMKTYAIYRKTTALLFVVVIVGSPIFSLALVSQSYFSLLHELVLVPMTTVIIMFILQHKATANLPYKTFRHMSTIFYLSHITFISVASIPFHYMLHRQMPFCRYLLVLCCCTLCYLIISKLKDKRYFGWLKYAY